MLKLGYYSATICNSIKITFNLTTMQGCLVWSGVRSEIPSHLKKECPNEKELGPLEFFCGEKTFNPLASKSKQFYHLLVSVKVKP